MKQYMKPTIMLSATSNPTAITCIQKVDTELILTITGLHVDNLNNAFADTEPCKEPLPIEFFCKFTSVDMGGVQAFIS